METVTYFILGGSKITADGDCSHEIKSFSPWKKSYHQPRQIIKSRDITWPTKVCVIKAMVFFSSHALMSGLDNKKSWALKNWCLQTMVLKKTLKRPLDCKEIKPINPKENQPWIFIVRTDAEVEAWLFWPPDAESQLIGKDPDARKDWR